MSDKITFSELVKSFADTHDLTQQKAEKLVRGLFNIVRDDLENEGKASITNFGSFSLKKVAERTGINPQTKEEIIIPAHNKVTFKPFKALETTVNSEYEDLEPKLLGDAPEKEEPKETVIETKEEESFDDPFESVISPAKVREEEVEEIEPVVEAEAEIESETEAETEEEPEATTPPAYKAPQKKKEESSATTWVLLVLILIIVGVGAWYFFLREPVGSTSNNDFAANEPAQTEQPSSTETTPTENMEPSEPMEKAVEPVVKAGATATTQATATTTNPAPKAMSTYTIKKDEWMWDISRKVYGEPYLWPLIFEANKTANDNPNLVEPANDLMVPEIEGTATALTKSDYAKLARASRLVAEAYGNAGNTERSAEYLRFAKKYERQSKN